MRISIGADHAGYLLKEYLAGALGGEHEVADLGTGSMDPVDYPRLRGGGGRVGARR